MPMYTLLLLAVFFANFPFLNQGFLGIIHLKEKHTWHRLLEMILGFILLAVMAYILENRTGTVHHQDWEFYVVVLCIYMVMAFPAFVWRYFWHGRNKE